MNPVEIAKGIYWVGSGDHSAGMNCNPYLLVDGEEAVLIDPGSVLDFQAVRESVSSIVDPRKIKNIILHHPDPDLASSLPLLESAGVSARVVTHWRSAILIRYYGSNLPYYLVNRREYKLALASGRILEFVLAPYLHFPSAIMTYDAATKTLFSSDLFGALIPAWSLWAGQDYEELMKSYHEQYMPSNEVIRPVIEHLMEMDIATIAPQHGSVIREDVPKYMRALRELDCGLYLSPVKKDLARAGHYAGLLTMVVRRMFAQMGRDEVLEVLKDSPVIVGESGEVMPLAGSSTQDLWERFFETVLERKGERWLSLLESLVTRLVNEYGIPYPAVYKSYVYRATLATGKLKGECTEPVPQAQEAPQPAKKHETWTIIDPLTELYNEGFMRQYLKKEIEAAGREQFKFGLIFMEIDNIVLINNKFGRTAGDETISHLAYLLRRVPQTGDAMHNDLIFKLNGAGFVYFMPEGSKEELVKVAESIRRNINNSEIFITSITVSMGIVNHEDISDEHLTPDDAVAAVYDTGRMKVRIARKTGKDTVYDRVRLDEYTETSGRLLIVDTDKVNRELLKKSFEVLKYSVETCADGAAALELCEKERPAAVISELMIPKLDGFGLRQKMMESTTLKDVPFILVSHEKNEASIQRALALRIRHYFKKPYFQSEIVGVVKGIIDESV